MITSRYIKLYKQQPSNTIIVDTVNIKDFIVTDSGGYQAEITYLACVKTEDFDNFKQEQEQEAVKIVKQEENKKLEEACNAVLRTDPFGKKYNGWKLIDIYKANFLWVDKYINESTNKFMVEKLKIIKEAVENGEIDV